MAAEQTAAQKAAEKQPTAPDEKAEQEAKAAQEKAEQEAKPKTDPRPRAAAAKSKGHHVTGAAVVLRTVDKAERYLYRGAVVPDGAFTEDSIKHAISVGLIEKIK